MNKNIEMRNFGVWRLLLLISFVLCSFVSHAQTIQGVVRDSITGEPIAYAAVRIDKTTDGILSDDNGHFKFTNKSGGRVLVCSFMGYRTKRITLPAGKSFSQDILLVGEGVSLEELIVRPKKEKYSKKNNPAVELIQNVIARKNNYTIYNQDYYKSEEYDRVFFALNEFNANKRPFKDMKFLRNYTDSSRIDKKVILPFSVRETLSDVYYRKDPKDDRRIIKAYKVEGVDQGMDMEALDPVVKEVFKTINLTDNTINILFHDFVSPLSSHSAVNFYKWYIIDTIQIDSKPYINLSFVPFNSRDVGFSGSLFIAADTTYALKRVDMRIPTKINLNFVEEMVVQQEFEQIEDNLWIPKQFITAIDVSMYDALKIYIEKVKDFSHFTFNQPVNTVFLNPAPEIYISDYKKKDKEFWDTSRPQTFAQDYKMAEMVEALKANKFINFTIKAANILSAGYVATNPDPEKNKFDIGTVLTFFSYNSVEGARFRLTGATTRNFHKNLYLYGYGAYGFKDKKPKYMGEVTWAFNRREYHKDEYPINNLSVHYAYDVNALGQQFLQAERDNILMSGSASYKLKYTYDRTMGINYHKENYNGFSFKLSANTHNSTPAGDLIFEKERADGSFEIINRMKTTDAGLMLRYAPNEKFYQQRRMRKPLPSKSVIIELSHKVGLKDVLGGQYNYNKTSFSFTKEFWIAPAGKIHTNIEAEKIWGTVPYPLLSSPNVNNSYTIQKGSFYLLEPLEFVGDMSATWNINYRMGGWLFNRIPLLNALKWREVFGFRGALGHLSKKNNPVLNKDTFVFPQETYALNKTPYMEYNIGIENIFSFFRIDYVRRINYKSHENVNKDGFRISFDMSF